MVPLLQPLQELVRTDLRCRWPSSIPRMTIVATIAETIVTMIGDPQVAIERVQAVSGSCNNLVFLCFSLCFFLNLNWSFEPRWRVVNGVGTVCSPDLKMTSCRRYNFYSSVPSWTSIIFARSATWGHQRLGQWRWNWYPGWSEVAPNFCSRHQNFTYLSQFGQALLNSFFVNFQAEQ